MPTGDWKIANARPAVDRVLDRCVEDENGCWVWQGPVSGRGRNKYGRITVGSRRDGTRRSRQVHQIVYEALITPVPEGLELDHLQCSRTECCNPWHPSIRCRTASTAPATGCGFTEADLLRRREWGATLHTYKKAAS